MKILIKGSDNSFVEDFFQISVDINTKTGLFAVYYGVLIGLANFLLTS